MGRKCRKVFDDFRNRDVMSSGSESEEDSPARGESISQKLKGTVSRSASPQEETKKSASPRRDSSRERDPTSPVRSRRPGRSLSPEDEKPKSPDSDGIEPHPSSPASKRRQSHRSASPEDEKPRRKDHASRR